MNRVILQGALLLTLSQAVNLQTQSGSLSLSATSTETGSQVLGENLLSTLLDKNTVSKGVDVVKFTGKPIFLGPPV